MPLPRALGRFNARVTNRLLGPVVRHVPGFGEIIHVGRRTGRTHRTPVLRFRHGDEVAVALTYGPRADWVRNVLVAGGARFESARERLELVEPRLVRDRAHPLVPRPIRPVLRVLRAPWLLVARVARD